MVIWPVLASSGKTADLVLARFGQFRSQRVNNIIFYAASSAERQS